jgi:hypothetical protein
MVWGARSRAVWNVCLRGGKPWASSTGIRTRGPWLACEVMSSASGCAKKREAPKPRQPYMELAVSLMACCRTCRDGDEGSGTARGVLRRARMCRGKGPRCAWPGGVWRNRQAAARSQQCVTPPPPRRPWPQPLAAAPRSYVPRDTLRSLRSYPAPPPPLRACSCWRVSGLRSAAMAALTWAGRGGTRVGKDGWHAACRSTGATANAA